tara:strand:+ start:38956 stop:39549 length:594 start_codon:yes stop_codon:yes gene_type:complete
MRFVLFAVAAVILSSCYTATYRFSPESSNYGIEFRKGTWLLNEIESPPYVKEELTALAIENFRSYLKDDLVYIRDTPALLGTRKIPLNPDREALKALKSGTGFDYIINIKAQEIKDELGGLQASQTDYPGTNLATVTLEIYDLENLEIIYLQHVRGSVSPNRIKEDVSFITTNEQILKKSFKKIFKKIEKNHTIKRD